MRALLILLLSASSAFAGSKAVTSKHKGVAAPPTADILQETFTDVSGGYATAGWAEVGSGTVNEDQASCPSGAGWSGQCLETTTGGTGVQAYSTWNMGSTLATVAYITSHVYAATLGTWSNTQEQIFFTVDSQDATTPSVFTAAAIAYLTYYADATTDPETPDCSAYPCFRIYTRIGGTQSASVPQFTTGLIHNLRFKITSGAATGEVWFDGTQIGSGQDSNGTNPHGAWQYIRAGQIENSKAAEVLYFDDITVSSTGYVD